MFRIIIPIILCAISVTMFFVFTSPFYGEISNSRAQIKNYDEALNNSKSLENERDKLTAKFNSINPENLMKIQKLLPENIDNIRLILEIEQIALPYGMALKDVKYSTTKDKEKTTGSAPVGEIRGGQEIENENKNYGVWELEFSVSGTYRNFIDFTKDLEKNLRIVDVASIEFSSGASSGSSAGEIYKYNFKIRTYWLKN